MVWSMRSGGVGIALVGWLLFGVAAESSGAWRREAGLGAARAVMDVVAGGTSGVLKLDGASGAVLWRHDVGGTVSAVATDAAGDVIAVGSVQNTVTILDLLVVKLAAATGAEIWRTEIDGDTVGSSD